MLQQEQARTKFYQVVTSLLAKNGISSYCDIFIDYF